MTFIPQNQPSSSPNLSLPVDNFESSSQSTAGRIQHVPSSSDSHSLLAARKNRPIGGSEKSMAAPALEQGAADVEAEGAQISKLTETLRLITGIKHLKTMTCLRACNITGFPQPSEAAVLWSGNQGTNIETIPLILNNHKELIVFKVPSDQSEENFMTLIPSIIPAGIKAHARIRNEDGSIQIKQRVTPCRIPLPKENNSIKKFIREAIEFYYGSENIQLLMSKIGEENEQDAPVMIKNICELFNIIDQLEEEGALQRTGESKRIEMVFRKESQKNVNASSCIDTAISKGFEQEDVLAKLIFSEEPERSILGVLSEGALSIASVIKHSLDVATTHAELGGRRKYNLNLERRDYEFMGRRINLPRQPHGIFPGLIYGAIKGLNEGYHLFLSKGSSRDISYLIDLEQKNQEADRKLKVAINDFLTDINESALSLGLVEEESSSATTKASKEVPQELPLLNHREVKGILLQFIDERMEARQRLIEKLQEKHTKEEEKEKSWIREVNSSEYRAHHPRGI